MSDALNLALTITATDMAGSVLNRLRSRIVGTGEAAQRVSKDFDRMTTSLTRGVKAAAVAGYIGKKMEPGIRSAANLQESLLTVKALLWKSSEGAGALAKKLHDVRRTAVQVSSNLPFSATDLANIEANLLQGGVALNSVVGRNGAAFATAALAAVGGGKMSPADVAASVAQIGSAWELTGRQYSVAADTMSRVSTSSAMTLSGLLHNMLQAGPAAHALGISVKDTAAALGALAPLREEAGTDLAAFFNGLKGTTPQVKQAIKSLGVSFFDAKGNFVGLDAAIKRLREGLAKLPTQQERLIKLQQIFQQQGSQAALQFLNTGKTSYEAIKRNSNAAASLAQRTKIWSEGLNASLAKLSGTMDSTLANYFNPTLGVLTAITNKTNDWVGALGDAADKNKALAIGVSGIGGAAAVAAGVYATGQILKGGAAGMRVLKGIRGLGGVAGGVAAGKALEAASGVTPVYVVNMPSGGIASDAASIARTEKGVPGLLRRIAPLAGRAGLWGAAGTAAFGGGYAIGTGINHGMEWIADHTGNKGWTLGGWIYDRTHGADHTNLRTSKLRASGTAETQHLRGTIKVEVNTTTGQARVKSMHSDHSGVNLTADTGLAGATS